MLFTHSFSGMYLCLNTGTTYILVVLSTSVILYPSALRAKVPRPFHPVHRKLH